MEAVATKIKQINNIDKKVLLKDNVDKLTVSVQQQYEKVKSKDIKSFFDLYKASKLYSTIELGNEEEFQKVAEEASLLRSELNKFGDSSVPSDYVQMYELRPDLLDPFCHVFKEQIQKRQMCEQMKLRLDEQIQHADLSIMVLKAALKNCGSKMLAELGGIENIQKDEKVKEDLADEKARIEKMNEDISQKVCDYILEKL